jgi:hypothetical protein
VAGALIGLLASLLAPLLIGHALLGALLPGGNALLRAALAVGIGHGVVALVAAAGALALGCERGALVGVEAVAVVVAFAIRSRMRRRAAPAAAPAPRALRAAAMVATLAAAVAFVLIARASPDGDGDALAIWNLRAKFLLRAWGEWPLVFDRDFLAHTDYPLLVPSLVARMWIYAGSETRLAPALLGGVFTLAALGAAYGFVAALRGRGPACLAVIALAGTPFFVHQGAQQTADVPLAFFVLAALGALLLRCGALAGCAAGLAAWTKNEGILFALVLGALLAMRALRDPRQRRALAALALGVLPGALAVAAFKLAVPAPNDLLASGWDAALQRALDAGRHAHYAGAFAERLVLLTEQGGPVGVGYAALAVYGLMVGRCPDCRVPGTALAALALMLLGYYAVFVALSPTDPVWHARTAIPRLLLHLWPATLCVALAFLRDPFGERHG